MGKIKELFSYIKEMYDEGFNEYEISKMLGIDYEVVVKILQSNINLKK
jgi:hypothetical protein